ncbi:MAG: glycoside hydrolase family 76 protein [Acidobacteria bacterium]|nr:glycoside hydrolase family 76 protein [Acidobacteriota bacterium]
MRRGNAAQRYVQRNHRPNVAAAARRSHPGLGRLRARPPCRARPAQHVRVRIVNRLLRNLLLAGVLLPCADRAQHNAADPRRAAELLSESAAGLQTLQGWYVEETGLWKTTGWWNAANGLTVLVDYAKLSDTPDLRATIANTFDRNSQKNFLNEYNDDEGWWALAWAGAYELTHEARYLAMAETIFADMAAGWDDTCGGGIWWKKPRQYKNAIANELFLSVAAKLASLTPDSDKRAGYLDWARREWLWFAASGMINSNNLVNDGLDATCHNNRRNTWTYNQGVILGGLTMLSAQSGDPKPLEAAQTIALSAMARLTDLDGVLHDTCEPARCGNDAPQFKGIFARNLAVLNAAVAVPGFRAFLRRNAESIWKNRDSDGRFGLVWSGPSEVKTAATQISALDALVAAAVAEGASGK